MPISHPAVIPEWARTAYDAGGLAGLWREVRARFEIAAAQFERLVAALEAVVDDEECTLDHDGNCQTHMGGSPCEVAEARRVIAEMRSGG